jgi:hypothetical protein
MTLGVVPCLLRTAPIPWSRKLLAWCPNPNAAPPLQFHLTSL